MTEIDILFVIIPIVISVAALLTTILIYIKKADSDQVNSVATQFQDLQKRVSYMEGRQAERDKGKSAV